MSVVLLWALLVLLFLAGIALLTFPKLLQYVLPALWCWDEDITAEMIEGIKHPFRTFWPFTAFGAVLVLCAAAMTIRMLS